MRVARKVVAKVAGPPEPPGKRLAARAVRPLARTVARTASETVSRAAAPTGADGPAATAFIGIGANLGQAQATVLQAMQGIGALPHATLLRRSSLYRTAPVDSTGPDYINAVVEISTTLDAHALLARLQALENRAGRSRPFRNAPRTLDLDLLLYADQAISTPSLAVPHPRMLQRAFVLVPLAEIAPQLVTARQLQAVCGQAIVRIGAG